MANNDRVYLFDTTLRDGAQTQGVDFSVSDKVAIARALDDLGLDYIEGGWPGANPTDDVFFASDLNLKKSRFVAFGMTKKHGVSASNDVGLSALVNSCANDSCIVGKSWDHQVEVALGVTLSQNLDMIGQSISYLAEQKGEAMLDAEHFFDGYKSNPDYALNCLKQAYEAGARWVILCDTRGGTLPFEIYNIVKDVCKHIPGTHIGIHAHNDSDNAVANSLAAVQAGARHVQGTINGLGERCGNANILSLIANLKLKMPYEIGIGMDSLTKLTPLSRMLDERIGRSPLNQQPYVGRAAFAHKGGLHASAVAKLPETYEHISPDIVGNERQIVMSNQAGRSNILSHLQKINIDMPDKKMQARFLNLLKEREYEGYSYDGADASFELLALEIMNKKADFFQISKFRVVDEKRYNARGAWIHESEATIKVNVKGQENIQVAEGNGPVNALDKALRKTLTGIYPELTSLELTDYKVRIIPPHEDERGTASITRVFIESADGAGNSWLTVGASSNVIDASALALCDSYNYFLYKNRYKNKK